MNTGKINYVALTLHELAEGFTIWRSQVFGLAKNDFRKKTKKTALGAFWLIFQPLVYIFCFWFALYVGIKSGKNDLDGLQYLLWLASGVMPYWFMRTTLSSAPGCLSSHSFLVTKLKFPTPLIAVFSQLSHFFVHIMLLVVLTCLYLFTGHAINIYFLQLPILMLLMLVFWTGYNWLVSSICVYSKDVSQLLHALTTPIFWLSGVIFDVTSIKSNLIQTVLLFNPVTFFCTSYRKVFSGVYQGWFWDDPVFLACGLGVIVVTVVAGILVFSWLRKDFADVL